MSDFAAIVIWREGEDGPEYLVIEYDSGRGIQIKFPGGTNDDHPGETVLETLHREVRDETGLVLPVTPKLIWTLTYPAKPRRDPHTKHAFLIPFEKCAGILRTEPRVDQGGDKPSPPFWRTAEELENTIFHTHKLILVSARREVR